MPAMALPGADTPREERAPFRWLMESDVCKHSTHAACLDVCPTGALHERDRWVAGVARRTRTIAR